MMIGGAALVAVLALGGIGAVAFSGDDGGADVQPLVNDQPAAPTGTGVVQINSDVSGGGELFANGTSQGPVVAGGQATLPAGTQHLELRVGGAVVASADVMVVPGQTAIANLNRAPQPPQPGEQVQTGTLAAGDATLQSGEYSDTFTFHWPAGTVHVEVRSTEFDPYVIVKPPNGGAQLDNDDMPGGTNNTAGLDVTVPVAGEYQVLVTSYAPGEVGNYQLVTR